MSQATLQSALFQAIEGIKRDPQLASAAFKAATQLEEDVRCTAKVRDFPAMTVDEPPEFGGSNQAMNPAELVLAALGTCQEIMYAAFASVMGIKLDELKIDCKGDLDLHGMFALDESVPAGFTDIQFETQIQSSEDPEKIRQLVEMAQSHCPLLDTLTRAVHTSGRVYLNGSELDGYESGEEIALQRAVG